MPGARNIASRNQLDAHNTMRGFIEVELPEYVTE